MDGWLNGRRVRVLKDDGCNTNFISREFAALNSYVLNIQESCENLNHSKKDSREEATQIVLDGHLKMGSHLYCSNWAVADCRYDVMLGMPWQVLHNPKVNYQNRTVIVEDEPLPLECDVNTSPSIGSIGVKKFRILLRKKQGKEGFEVFQVLEANNLSMATRGGAQNAKLEELLERYEDLFREELPAGLPRERNIDDAIEIDKDAKPPHRPLYQLSPAELLSVREYLVNLLRKAKIRRSKSPFGSPLFF